MDKICSYFGHRKIDAGEAYKFKLKQIYTDLIVNQNFNIFYFGGYGEFDKLCYQTVCELKNTFSYIKIIFVRPYYEDMSLDIINLYKNDFDDCIYLKTKNKLKRLSIISRNFEMVNVSDFIVFYVTKINDSGAGKVYKYAKQKKKNFINLI